MVFQILQVIAAPFPGELTGVAGGFVYGETIGFILSTIGLSIGSWVAFELASILGRPFVERFVKREVLEKFNFLTTKTGVVICFVLFLFPGFPKDYLCYVLGLSRMSLTLSCWYRSSAECPELILLTMQGATIRNEQYHTFAIFIGVTLGRVLAIGYIYRNQMFAWIKHRHDHD